MRAPQDWAMLRKGQSWKGGWRMAAYGQRRNLPRSLVVEPLEDRLLLSITSASPVPARGLLLNQEILGAAADVSPVVHHSDPRSEWLLSRLADWNPAHRLDDRAEQGRSGRWEEAVEEWYLRAADEWMRLMRAESEVVGLIRESPVVTSHETFAQSVIQNDSENLYQSANLNEPVQNVAETASLPLSLPGSLNQSLDSEIATIARAPDGEHPPAVLVPTDEGRDSASTALVVTAKELPIPVVAIPLLERLQSELPDTRQAVDAFL